MTAPVTRRVVIHDGILRHDPSKPADYISNISGVRARSLTEGVERLSIPCEAVVKESVEVLLRYRVDGVVIEQVPLQGDVGSGGRDQIPAPLRPPDTTSVRMVCIDSVDPKQGQGEHHRQCENEDTYLENTAAERGRGLGRGQVFLPLD